MFGQGFTSMAPPTADLMNLVKDKKIRHGNHPILDWCVGNMVVAEDPAGNQKPDKKRSTEKIDGAVAMIMGLARAVLNGRSSNSGSVYNERGLIFI